MEKELSCDLETSPGSNLSTRVLPGKTGRFRFLHRSAQHKEGPPSQAAFLDATNCCQRHTLRQPDKQQ